MKKQLTPQQIERRTNRLWASKTPSRVQTFWATLSDAEWFDYSSYMEKKQPALRPV